MRLVNCSHCDGRGKVLACSPTQRSGAAAVKGPAVTIEDPNGATAQTLHALYGDPLPLPTVDAVIQARNYTKGRKTKVDLLVLHTTENQCVNGVARNVALWFAGASAPQASAQYVVGPDVTIQCVSPDDTAWHAPGANDRGIGIEQTGRASFTAEQWASPEVQDMLFRSATLVARLCAHYGIPIVRLSVDELRAGKAGIVGHVDVTKAFGKSNHVDPGGSFPWSQYIAMIQEASQ